MYVGQCFEIIVFFESRHYKMSVKCTYVSDQIERYSIFAGKKSIYLRNDRPMKVKAGKKTGIQWKIESGYAVNAMAFHYTLQTLEKQIFNLDNN